VQDFPEQFNQQFNQQAMPAERVLQQNNMYGMFVCMYAVYMLQVGADLPGRVVQLIRQHPMLRRKTRYSILMGYSFRNLSNL
jgi:hypothetical protein